MSTSVLKKELWKRFGSPEHPAEWDGRVYGGGKLSQRYWEYFRGVELLEVDAESVIVDIGGGSPVTGAGFFSSLLSTVAKKVLILDPNIKADQIPPPNIEFIRRNASFDELKELFQTRPEITHVSCISVFEHVAPEIRSGIIRATNEFFHGRSFVATLEYHPTHRFFEHQLTAKSLSTLFESFTNFYPDDISASPVFCENSFDRALTLRVSKHSVIGPSQVPRWYPVAIRFLRAD